MLEFKMEKYELYAGENSGYSKGSNNAAIILAMIEYSIIIIPLINLAAINFILSFNC